jgi:hypothetical protein
MGGKTDQINNEAAAEVKQGVGGHSVSSQREIKS